MLYPLCEQPLVIEMFIETHTMAHGPPKPTPLSINTAVCVFSIFAKHWKPIQRSYPDFEACKRYQHH